ncbi:unnamed protein product [Cylindrotheca closterium]|uniref:Kinesin-like protein n=1 Tax=Cylindrotheca closterium TaxID=2856 RepID=A0AAD2PVZ0_9STRA|nr:unnamed protein product [Cylindrotheca closterium]
MTEQKKKSGSSAKSTSSSSSQSNIRVVARIRPLAKYELENGSKQIVNSLPSLLGSSPATGPTTEPEVLEVKPPNAEKRWFEVDAVFDGISTQRDVYVKSGAQQAVCQDIFKGFNCTILAYGQTGSGKTFSMGTAAGSTEITENDGIIPRATADLFRMIDERCDGNAQVELSYLEIYNEEIRDLMVDDETGGKDLRVRETLNGEVYVSGLQSLPVANPQEIGKCMEDASKRRVVASTKMNAVSSRSHAICALKVKGVLEDSTKFHAKLTLVDLAGSERIKKTGAQGSRQKEGININKGLFILGQVVSALAEQRPKYKRKPPYRDSKLTRLLQDSLGGNSRTIMLACVSPADFNLDETVNTLRYATSARNIKNSATRNVIKTISPEEAAKLQRENQLLQAQVKELQETIQRMAQDASPSMASADTDSDDDMDIELVENKAEAKRIRDLESEVKQLKAALNKKGGAREISQSMADNAIVVPELNKKVATLEEELKMKEELEEENIILRQELEEVKADAQSARVAANKMSKIMDQLRELKGEEIDKKRMEHDHIKVEEAWVSFVFQVLETNKEQMQKLRDDFYLVARVVESPDVLIPAKSNSKWWQRLGNKEEEGGPPEMTVDPEMRQQLLSEHIQFFNEKLLEVENDIATESESLGSIRDSLRQQRDRLEIEIGSHQFEKDSLDKNDNDLLEQLTALLIGPVKNLGDFA